MIRQRVALPALSEWALSAPTRKPGVGGSSGEAELW